MARIFGDDGAPYLPGNANASPVAARSRSHCRIVGATLGWAILPAGPVSRTRSLVIETTAIGQAILFDVLLDDRPVLCIVAIVLGQPFLH